MKTKIFYFFMVVAIFLFGDIIVHAQVKTKIYYKGIPNERVINALNNEAEVTIAPPENFKKLLAGESVEDNREYSNTFAIPVKLNVDVLTKANKITDNKFITYYLSLSAHNALNLSLQFSDFLLSDNSVLSIFTSHELTDSITAKENNPGNIWATRVYQGEKIYITLKTPLNEAAKSRLTIGQIGLGYKKAGGEFFGNPGASATCNVNVACATGNGWQNERSAVAIVLVADGTGTCTGTLTMNTCGTNIPYVLTANHCLKGNMANWVFQYQYWSTDCTTNTGWTEDIQFNGCTLRANNCELDFALVEMSQTPPTNSGITYAGWSRSTTPPTSGATLHHPRGDLMKISLFNTSATSVSWSEPNSACPSTASNHWRVSFNQGIVQHGSSGAALFNQDHRIVGQLHGNQNNICGNPGTSTCWCTTLIPSIGEYGRFDISWTGGGTNSTRLSNWLDPGNTGSMTTNTTDVANLGPSQPVVDVSTLNISGPQIICNSSDYFITNLPAGATVTWSIPAGSGNVLQLSANTPAANQLRITNQKWYNVNTTLTAIISNLPCGIANQTRTLAIANDNSTSASEPYPYYQESCTFYGVSHPNQSGTIYSNSSPVFVHQGCMVHVTIGNMTGITVSLGSGGTPLYWGTSGSTLNFQLPLGSGGIPFTFKIDGDGACFQRTLLFFSYTGNARYAFGVTPNPANDQLIVTAKEDEKYVKENGLSSGEEKLQFIMNIYDVNTNTLQITERSAIGSMQHKLNVSKLKRGYYVVQIISGKETQTIKFFKE